jgi:hypothetical protein
MKKIHEELTFASGDTTKTVTFGVETGDHIAVIMGFTAFDSVANATRTVTVKDRAGNTMYSKASLADAAFTLDDTKKIVLERGGSVTVLMSTAPTGTGGTDKVDFYCERE